MAFYMCLKLESVNFEGDSQLISIGDQAFMYCQELTSITIPEGVKSIGAEAFSWDQKLEQIVIPSSVTSIGDKAFYYDIEIETISFGKKSQLEIIGNEAFYSCINLTSIEIPNSITSIGENAFACCGKLTSIKYQGLESQWNEIAKCEGWDSYTGKYTITYEYTGE